MNLLASMAAERGCIDVFVDAAARFCAAIPTRTERRTFYAVLEACLDAAQCEQFRPALEAEWWRLRAKGATHAR
ncbi:hypothetical protein [Paraburkholderia susongensis]|uniref:hypothetical protein n=1 Tax=Paraburkholderia susongensis TaxID=1515439 RepID=UPI0011802D89|nr:hypothetical protein [Paraburkholderia susongensis]